MTILCAHTPDFLYRLAARQHADWDDGSDARERRPVVLTGPDDRIWAASPLALAAGALPGLTPRQARARCPDAAVHSLDTNEADAAQAAFIGVLARTGLPVEPQSYGAAYCDLSAISRSPGDARPVCADLGKQIRAEIGVALTPALGVDHGKFTAHAAARAVPPGRMRLIDRADEVSFLSTQPLTLLPLPPEHVQQLNWLGLKTLADFARLPASAVAARFGKAGKLAQQWARGADERPVRALAQAAPEAVTVEFETPCASLDRARDAIMHALAPRLREMAERLEGCRRIQIELHGLDSARAHAQAGFAQPMCAADDLRAGVSRALAQREWPGELSLARVLLLDLAELAPQALTLFGETLQMGAANASAAPFARVLNRLGAKHGAAFFQGVVVDPAHPIPERRTEWRVGVES